MAEKQSEERYRSIVENQIEMICCYQADGTITFVNAAYCRYFNKNQEELIGHKFFPLIPDADREKVFESISNLNPKKSIVTHEHRVLAPSGEVCWHKWTNRAIFDDQNKLKEYQAVGWDITERKQIEKDLQESEEKYRLLTENAKDMIYRMSLLDGVYEYVSPASINLFGYTAEEFYESPMLIQKIIHPAWTDYFEEQWENLVSGNMPPYYEYQIMHKSGEERWMHQRNVLILNDSGQPEAIEGIVTDITERKQVERALQESQERFKQLSEASFEAVAYHKDGILFKANEQYFNMFGYDPDELIGKNAMPLTVAPESIELMKKQISSGSKETYEAIGLRENGTKFPMEIRVRETAYQGDTIRVAIIRDMSTRKKIEMALRESEEKYRGLFDESIAAVYLFDEKKNFLDSNQAGLDLLGYSREELLNMSITDVDADPIVVLPAHEQLLGGERIINYEHRLNRKDGKVITVLNNSRPITDTNGHVIGMQSTLIDITERKQILETLRESEERLAAFMDSATDGFILFDSELNYLKMNKAGQEISGVDRKDITGKNIVDVIPDIKETGRYDIYKKVVKTGVPLVIPDLIPHPKFGNRRINLKAFKVGDGLGVIFTDITERIQAEEELQKAHEELEQRVEERTKDLEIKTKSLEELNTALKVLLEKRSEDKTKLEDNVLTNVKELTEPLFDKMRKTGLDDHQKMILSIIESNLNEITSPLTRKLSLKYLKLTPTEIKIANLIRHGTTSKKIAKLMNSSPRTIDTHRKNIRRKMGLEKKRANLRSYLLSIG